MVCRKCQALSAMLSEKIAQHYFWRCSKRFAQFLICVNLKKLFVIYSDINARKYVTVWFKVLK
jgi:hypothetical protein